MTQVWVQADSYWCYILATQGKGFADLNAAKTPTLLRWGWENADDGEACGATRGKRQQRESRATDPDEDGDACDDCPLSDNSDQLEPDDDGLGDSSGPYYGSDAIPGTRRVT